MTFHPPSMNKWSTLRRIYFTRAGNSQATILHRASAEKKLRSAIASRLSRSPAVGICSQHVVGYSGLLVAQSRGVIL